MGSLSSFLSPSLRRQESFACLNPESNPRCRPLSGPSASYPTAVVWTGLCYLLALTPPVLPAKAPLRAEHPERLCSRFSFSKNRTEVQGPWLGKQWLLRPSSSPGRPRPPQRLPGLPAPRIVFSCEGQGPTESLEGNCRAATAAPSCPWRVGRGLQGDDAEMQFQAERTRYEVP